MRCLILLLLALATPLVAAAPASDASSKARAPVLSWQQARLFADVLKRVRAEYVEPVDDSLLIELALRGMLEGLDPHSTYLAPAEYEQLEALTQGSYDGVGLDLTIEPAGLRVVAPVPGSPAARAGLVSGDVVTAIDGRPISSIEPGRAIELLRGDAGTAVEISVRHEDGTIEDALQLTRERVRVASVSVSVLEPGYLHLRITQFGRGTARDLARELERVGRAGPAQGAILDLRGNGGGIFEAAVEVADLFLDDGLIVTSEGRASDASFERRANAGDALSGAPLVVLVDGATASAAEIVAGALKDRHRGVLIGRNTLGKGSVQTVLPLAQGGALKFTSARWRTPSGAAIPATGIEPDVPLDALPALSDPQGLAQSDPALAQALLAVKAARLARAP